ncbi:MAG: RluA family pseudouridine synthase [Clostridiales bacterium]|nr:RluA family pseudouridine synthase [Clostridiales bacterium]
MKQLTIMKNDADMRLDRFLSKAVPSLPASLCQKYIRTGRVKVNGRPSSRETRLNVGDVLSLYINDEFFSAPTEDNAWRRIDSVKLDIVYEDANILLADKKPGMLCHAGGDGDASNTLIANIQAYLYKSGEWRPEAENSFAPALCNRIDRNTGGIVIAAKNAEALRIIDEKMRMREIDKYYLCLVHGRPSPPSGRLEDYLFKDSVKNRVYVRRAPEKGARASITEYRTLASKNGLSLLECRLLTGRTHQIRAQLASHGHPLLGDGKYGSRESVYAEKHQALSSYKLIFSFKEASGILEYLRGRCFMLRSVDFVEKYFDSYVYH